MNRCNNAQSVTNPSHPRKTWQRYGSDQTATKQLFDARDSPTNQNPFEQRRRQRTGRAMSSHLKAFRCHRFAGSNETDTAMLDAGMTISSNVCTDLEMIPPFRNRSGLLEVPIFMEDGGYLHRGHSLRGTSQLNRALQADGIKVLLLHPMHFALNTPHFGFMVNIKKRLSRTEWTGLSSRTLQDLRWHERGIADLLIDILKQTRNADFATVGDITAVAGAAPSQTLTFRRRA